METYTIEPMMHNGVALQGGTSHYFGDGFAKAFDITFTDKDNQIKYPHQTSWGVSTRMIGAIIMTHGDNNGLILPPAIAPIQIVVIPVQQHKEGVLEKAASVTEALKKAGLRVYMDQSDNSPGWKYSQYEMKGVPVRLELGPRDIENNSCVLVSRVTREKKFVSLDNLEEEVQAMLKFVHDELVERALKNREEKTHDAHTHEEFLEIAANRPGFIRAMWCGDSACEGSVEGRNRRREIQVHSLHRGTPFRHLRVLWKKGQTHGGLGQTVLRTQKKFKRKKACKSVLSIGKRL